MTRSLTLGLAFFSALLAALASPLPADAKSKRLPPPAPAYQGASADHYSTPLMVVRFNQRKVYFERQLYEAVSRAVEAKPSVRFLLVSHVPQYGSSDTAERNFNKVYRTLTDMGVPASRISSERFADGAITESEVHVFVR